ncbi:MAG TPA: hypothetical protein PK956_11715 [Burkholderiaceae bacterium]|jgi:hypothetical protein|nr:hypothetical protein [Burkholderiaceae bacterium]
MTRNGFVVLLLLTVAAIGVGAQIAERYADPGLGRTLIVAVFTALVVFPAARFAERRGWIRGELDFSKLGRRGNGVPDERGDAK